MEQLIELLQQIQDLAGAGIDALKGAKGDEEKAPPKEGGAPGGPPEGGGGGGGAPPPEKGAPQY